MAQGALWLALIGAVAVALVVLRAQTQALAPVESVGETTARLHSRPAPAAPPALPSGLTLELTADARGHFITTAHISGRPVRVLVDTGATTIALRWEDAQAAGVHVRESDFNVPVNTANGVTHIAMVTIDAVSLGDIEVRNVRAAVARQGQLHVTLLGMSFLKQLSRVDFRGRTLVLSQ